MKWKTPQDCTSTQELKYCCAKKVWMNTVSKNYIYWNSNIPERNMAKDLGIYWRVFLTGADILLCGESAAALRL